MAKPVHCAEASLTLALLRWSRAAQQTEISLLGMGETFCNTYEAALRIVAYAGLKYFDTHYLAFGNLPQILKAHLWLHDTHRHSC